MKFIFVTGHGSDRDFQTGVAEVGVDYYLVKPLKIEDLDRQDERGAGKLKEGLK